MPLDAAAGPAYVIGVDGPSGAGKSDLAARLAASVDGAVLRMDDLYPGWHGLEPSVPRVVAWALRPLRSGRPARWRRWDWVRREYAEWHELPRREVVVVEGVGAGARACAPYLDLLLWLDAPEAERYRRAMARDGVTYRPYWRGWAAAERAHHRREGTRERADVILAG